MHASSMSGRASQLGFGISAVGVARAARSRFDFDAARASKEYRDRAPRKQQRKPK